MKKWVKTVIENKIKSFLELNENEYVEKSSGECFCRVSTQKTCCSQLWEHKSVIHALLIPVAWKLHD